MAFPRGIQEGVYNHDELHDANADVEAQISKWVVQQS